MAYCEINWLACSLKNKNKKNDNKKMPGTLLGRKIKSGIN